MSRWAAAFRVFAKGGTPDNVDSVATVGGQAEPAGHSVYKVNTVTPPALIQSALMPWYDGVAAMQMMPSPPRWTDRRWWRACLDAAALLEVHGADLQGLGWTASDVFGLHPEAPGGAVDAFGLALLLGGGMVAELTGDGAMILRPSGAQLTMRRGSRRAAVPAWEMIR